MAVRRPGKKILLLLCSIGVILIPCAVFYKVRSNENSSSPAQTYRVLGAQTNLPVYTTNKDKEYPLLKASAEDGAALILSSYDSMKGIINVTQQPRPVEDPFGKVTPVDTFSTSIGEAKLYPDDKSNPYIIVETPLSWIIVRSTSLQISSENLKEFCLSLREVSSK